MRLHAGQRRYRFHRFGLLWAGQSSSGHRAWDYARHRVLRYGERAKCGRPSSVRGRQADSTAVLRLFSGKRGAGHHGFGALRPRQGPRGNGAPRAAYRAPTRPASYTTGRGPRRVSRTSRVLRLPVRPVFRVDGCLFCPISNVVRLFSYVYGLTLRRVVYRRPIRGRVHGKGRTTSFRTRVRKGLRVSWFSLGALGVTFHLFRRHDYIVRFEVLRGIASGTSSGRVGGTPISHASRLVPYYMGTLGHPLPYLCYFLRFPFRRFIARHLSSLSF